MAGLEISYIYRGISAFFCFCSIVFCAQRFNKELKALMLKKFFQFLIYLLLFSLILFVAWELLHVYLPENLQYSGIKNILLFYTFLTAAFHFGALRSNNKSNAGFMRFYVAATTFKLLILMGIMVAYAIINPVIAIPFVVYFFAAYLLYTAFETTIIYKFLKL